MPLSAVIVYFGLAWLVGHLGRDKKFGFWGHFAVAALVSPVIGALVLFACDDKATA